MLSKALQPEANVSEIARRAGIPKGTLFSWVAQASVEAMSSRGKKKRGRPRTSMKRSAEEKLRLLTEAAGLRDEELGAFLRKEGLHEADLAELRDVVLASLAPAKRSHGLTPSQVELQRLKRELVRKEKALAETAALLVLSKKYRAIMGDEDDDTGESNGENS